MPQDKHGNFHMNPQIAKMHDQSDGHGEPDGDEPKGKKFEAHKNDDGSIHTAAQNEDGTSDERDGDIEDAKQHLHEHLSDDQDDQDGDEHVDVRAADDGAY